MNVVTTTGKGNHAVDLHILASRSTPAAADAGVGINSNRRMFPVGLRPRRPMTKARCISLDTLHETLEKTIRMPLRGRLTHFRRQQLDNDAPCASRAIAIRIDLESGRGRLTTRRHQFMILVYLNEAGPTCTNRLIALTRAGTQMRQVNPRSERSFENRLP
ncbi:MAG: hypothetical protein ACJAVZ_003371 [Afipia broomeae]